MLLFPSLFLKITAWKLVYLTSSNFCVTGGSLKTGVTFQIVVVATMLIAALIIAVAEITLKRKKEKVE